MPTTLGRRAGNDGVAALVGQHALNQADLAAEVMPEAGAHAAGLRDFAEFVFKRGTDDQRIYALYRLQPDTDAFEVGENQALLFARLGTAGPLPSNEDTLNELVAAAVDDHLESGAAELSHLRTELARLESALETSEAARKKAESSSAALERVEADLVAANAELDTLRRHNAHFRAMLPAQGEDTAERRDWKAVEGYPGIYEKPNADGQTIYRIGWREDGKQRWKATGPVLAEAIEAREAVTEAVPA